MVPKVGTWDPSFQEELTMGFLPAQGKEQFLNLGILQKCEVPFAL
jgi:hypothetical protein